MTGALLTHVADVRRFALGGAAVFTLVSKKTGARFTYRVSAVSDSERKWFVSVLTGPDNEQHYQYVGLIVDDLFFPSRHKGVLPTAPSSKAFAWFWSALAVNVLPDALEVWHEGRCGRCGRRLTVPASIATGFGPECAEVLGVESALSRDLRRVNERQGELL